jgi:hypothetical protein
MHDRCNWAFLYAGEVNHSFQLSVVASLERVTRDYTAKQLRVHFKAGIITSGASSDGRAEYCLRFEDTGQLIAVMPSIAKN